MQAEALWQHCIEKLTLPGRLGWGMDLFLASGLILNCAHIAQACLTHQNHLSRAGI
jgi:hypothetical protein